MDWIKSWNERYDRAPEDIRFGLIVAAMLLVGMVNMLLTIHANFPFGLLLLAAILFVAGIRLAYVMETPPEARGGVGSEPDKLDIGWLYRLNHWYDTMPEDRQFWVLPVVLLLAGFINMMLTLAHAFPFGLLFLLVVLALVAIRLPYDRGWLRVPPSLSLAPAHAVGQETAAIPHEAPAPALSGPVMSEAVMAEPVMAEPAPSYDLVAEAPLPAPEPHPPVMEAPVPAEPEISEPAVSAHGVAVPEPAGTPMSEPAPMPPHVHPYEPPAVE